MYRDRTGKYQGIYDHLFATLVPPDGEASTMHGELLRITSLLYEEWHRGGKAQAGIHGFALLSLVREASNARASALAGQIINGTITEQQLEEFADWAILYAATQSAGGAPDADNGMILVAITDGNLQTMAMAHLGRMLSAEEIMQLAEGLDAETRRCVADYLSAQIAERGWQ